MILRRITEHVKDQNWFAVLLDFVIVVFGVFMGFQVNNWNQERGDVSRSIAYLQRISDDVETDITNYEDRIKFWGAVKEYSMQGLRYSETKLPGKASQWQLLLGYFQASQVAEFIVSSSTYDELKNAGELDLIKDSDLRISLGAYYNFEAEATLRQRPQYREHIRGKIPTDIQEYIWDNCWSSNKEGLQELIDCPSPVDKKVAEELVERFSSNTKLMEELRYWASNLKVSSLIAQDRINEATALRRAIEHELNITLGQSRP